MAGVSTMIKKAVAAALVVGMTLPSAAVAGGVVDRPTGAAMFLDGLVVRPILLATTVVGSALFVVTLPFSALGGNVEEAADTLAVTPFKATFTRCLGCTTKHEESAL